MTDDERKTLEDARELLSGLSMAPWLDGIENSLGSVQRQCGDLSAELLALLDKDVEA